jgi:hypothetical protein
LHDATLAGFLCVAQYQSIKHPRDIVANIKNMSI